MNSDTLIANNTPDRIASPISSFKRSKLFILVNFLLFAFSKTNAQPAMNYAVYANIIYRFTKYVEWPAKVHSPDFVIGVVGDSHYYDIHQTPGPAAWFAFQDFAPYMPTLHVRISNSNTGAMSAAVRQELDRIDKGFPVFNVKTLEVRIEESLSRERILAGISGAVGLLALALAAVGLYGILAYTITRRTREIGIRMALGSSVWSVLWLVVRQALALIALGSVLGVAISFSAWQLLSQRVSGVSAIDGSVLSVCAIIMLVVGAIAVTVPAIRACRIDPLMALRHE